MTNRTDSGARRLACSRCGTEFGCDPVGACWCKEETLRLPMPLAGEDCLCRDCLRKAAKGLGSPESGQLDRLGGKRTVSADDYTG